MTAFKRVCAGDGHEVVLIAGEAGLGKTTIASEFARSAHGQGATVLFGHCQEETGAPYQPFREALGHYVTHAPRRDVDEPRRVFRSHSSG